MAATPGDVRWGLQRDATHVQPPPHIDGVEWMKITWSGSWDVTVHLPTKFAVTELEQHRAILQEHAALIVQEIKSDINKRYCIMFASCFLCLPCLTCLDNPHQRRMAELLASLDAKLGSDFHSRYYSVQRKSTNGQGARTIEDDIWLGIAYGSAAADAMLALPLTVVKACGLCGSDPNIRVI